MKIDKEQLKGWGEIALAFILIGWLLFSLSSCTVSKSKTTSDLSTTTSVSMKSDSSGSQKEELSSKTIEEIDTTLRIKGEVVESEKNDTAIHVVENGIKLDVVYDKKSKKLKARIETLDRMIPVKAKKTTEIKSNKEVKTEVKKDIKEDVRSESFSSDSQVIKSGISWYWYLILFLMIVLVGAFYYMKNKFT